jgi:3-oxoacyl-[acyl-carrier protein] reductase
LHLPEYQKEPMDLGLAGTHCVVTGASSGIGRGVAVALAAEGALVTILGRNEHALAETASQVEAKSTSAGFDQQCRGGRPYNLDSPLGSHEWDQAFHLNFTAVRRLTEHVLPAMRQARWGRVITVTGSLALQRMNAATPAKAAITSWCRALSIQVAP